MVARHLLHVRSIQQVIRAGGGNPVHSQFHDAVSPRAPAPVSLIHPVPAPGVYEAHTDPLG